MTVSPIPENVIRVESVLYLSRIYIYIYISGLTEVICSNQWWDGSISITWTFVGSVCQTILPCSISKCPDVLLRTAIHYSHTTDIGTVNCSCVADFCHITLMFSFELHLCFLLSFYFNRQEREHLMAGWQWSWDPLQLLKDYKEASLLQQWLAAGLCFHRFFTFFLFGFFSTQVFPHRNKTGFFLVWVFFP